MTPSSFILNSMFNFCDLLIANLCLILCSSILAGEQPVNFSVCSSFLLKSICFENAETARHF